MESLELPEWLRRYVYAKRLIDTVNAFKRVYVPTSDEVVRVVGEHYKKLRPRRRGLKGRRELEIKRLEVVYNVVKDRLSKVASLPTTKDMDDFHAELIRAFVDRSYDEALMRVRKALKLVRRFWDEYRLMIVSSRDPREMSRYRREGCGRMLSVVRRLRRSLEILRSVRNEIVKTHVISEGLPVVVVAGVPNAGKSTFVGKVSTVKPEVAPYPFTTKTLLVGKVAHDQVAFYLIDTPGLLDREARSPIERKALAALSTLPDAVVFLVDPTPSSVQTLNSQLNLLRNTIAKIAMRRGCKILIAVNKIDILPQEKVDEVVRQVEEKVEDLGSIVDSIHRVSMVTGQGLDALLNSLAKVVKSRILETFKT